MARSKTETCCWVILLFHIASTTLKSRTNRSIIDMIVCCVIVCGTLATLHGRASSCSADLHIFKVTSELVTHICTNPVLHWGSPLQRLRELRAALTLWKQLLREDRERQSQIWVGGRPATLKFMPLEAVSYHGGLVWISETLSKPRGFEGSRRCEQGP